MGCQQWCQRLLIALTFLLVTPSASLLVVPGGIAYADDDDDDDDARPRRRAELVMAGLTEAQRARLERNGFRIARQAPSSVLQGQIARVEGPPGRSAASALRLAQSLAPGVLSARNDLFRRFRVARYGTTGDACRERCEAFAITGWQPSLTHCTMTSSIGVVDTRVDAGHPSLAGAKLVIKNVRRPDRKASDPAHGTGVVSLLVGQPGSSVVGTLPQARVFAADAFHRSGASDAADTFDLVAAIDWLSESGVRVINLSLSGPANPVLATAIERVTARGVSVVAAAGRPDGGATGYPARYPLVLAVSAVDVRLGPSRLSARGQHIAFAGPGMGLVVADPKGGHRIVNGTSFAAPFVTAALAASIGSPGKADQAVERLRSAAKDLGAPGRDPIFGWGLVQFVSPLGC